MSIVRPSRRRATALVAGPFHDVLCVEVRTAVGRCTGCGRTDPMAEVRAWSNAVRSDL